MRIQEIEIDNFKSFRHLTKIPFLPGFTAISGPNGSGKSNIIDSVLFCLGLSSSKTLRAEKLTDLINNQTNRREARVNIRFGDDDSTFEVGRRIRESENGYQSTYFLNGRVSTLSELHDLLALHHVSPHGYNVVMQGDVTRIISMTGFERRKIIDELAGVAEFDSRVDQAHKELSKVNEQHERSSLILDEIHHRLIQLQAERDHAIRYKALTEERNKYEAQTKLTACWELRQKIAGLADMLLGAEERRHSIEDALMEVEEQLADKQAGYKALLESIKLKDGDELLNIQNRIMEARGALERERAAYGFLATQIGDLGRQGERDLESKERLELRLEDLTRQRSDLVAQKERYSQDFETSQAEYARLQEAIMELYRANEEVSQKAQELRNQLNTTKNDYNDLWREKLRLEDAANRVSDRVAQQKEELSKAKSQLKTLQGEAAEIEKTLQAAQEDLAGVNQQMEAKLADQRQAQSDLHAMEKEAEQARSNYLKVEARFKAAEENAFGKAVETILKMNLQGVHGTLAQLGSADDRYAQALEIAAGAKLRFLVCDTDSVAARGIQILKERHAGRATFLPLNKIQPARSRRPVKEKGFIGYAIDLVKFDEKYRDAFAFAFGETLVVDHIDNARPHIGEYRMVTLEGELLERSGAMTGGSEGKNSLRFTASLAKELEEAKAFLADSLVQLNKDKEAATKITWEIDALKAKKEGINDRLRSNQLEAADRTRRIESHQAEVTRLKEAVAASNEEENDLREKVEGFFDQLMEREAKINDLEMELSDLEMALAETQLDELNSKASGAEFKVKSLETQIKNTEVDLQGVDSRTEDAKQSLTSLEAEMKHRQEQLDGAIAEQGKNKVRQDSLEGELAELEMRRGDLRAKLGELYQEREDLQEEIRAVERKRDERKHELDRLLEGMSSTREQKAQLEPELAEMENQLWLNGIEPPKEPVGITSVELQKRIEHLTSRMRSMEPVNMLAIEEYETVSARGAELERKLNELQTERAEIITRIEEFARLKKASFMESFVKVNRNFEEIFHELSQGSGELVLEDPEDPFNGGLIIKAQPQDKKMQRLEAMSGGEKSLTALAFVFSLQRVNPAPFYAMDEVDMMLDGVNAERLAEMIKEQTKRAQLIVVSHRKPMLTRADQTVGVSARSDGVSKVTGVKWHD